MPNFFHTQYQYGENQLKHYLHGKAEIMTTSKRWYVWFLITIVITSENVTFSSFRRP